MKLNVFLFIVIVLSMGCNTLHSNAKFSKENNPVIAHRGAFKKLNLPENSIAALKQAIKLGCTGSEFDVHATSDSVLVVNHDPDFFNLVIEKTPYAELAQHKQSNGETIPKLRDFLMQGLRNNKGTMLVCEIKPSIISKERGQYTAEKVLEMVRELKAEKRVVYISFDYDILLRILALNPKANTQYLTGDKSPVVLKKAGIDGADYHISVFREHPEWIQQAKDQNIKLNAWTVNDVKDMHWLLQNNFDYITTNEPERLLELLK